MNRLNLDRKAARKVVCTALATVLVAGCASSGTVALKKSSSVQSVKLDRAAIKAIAKAEKAVAKRPQSAAARADLASAYLMAGRFESAVTTFEDARQLGDSGLHTALSLALAYVAIGNSAAAVEILDSSRDLIPASDYGLALALAGDTTRGVDVLADALRNGDDTAKLRQNLAYAYALDGRWRDARLMAAQDVPADQLDARISEWARQGKPDDFRVRVAGMLGAPVLADQGQPTDLALGRTPADVPEVPAYDAQLAANEELPPVESGESFWLAEAVRPEPADIASPAAPVPASVDAPAAAQSVAALAPAPAPSSFDQAFVQVAPKPSFTSTPVVQFVPERAAQSPEPRRKTRTVARSSNLVQVRKVGGSASHLVQLGSFSSKANADRAWSIFVSRNPELREFDRTVSEAMVRGKKYWRISAAGFDRRSARKMCSTVKQRGGACIAWAKGRPLPGAL